MPQIFYFPYYWIHGYRVPGLQKQTGDEYWGAHDFFPQGNAVPKCDFLLAKQKLHVSVVFSKGNYRANLGLLIPTLSF